MELTKDDKKIISIMLEEYNEVQYRRGCTDIFNEEINEYIKKNKLTVTESDQYDIEETWEMDDMRQIIDYFIDKLKD